MGKKGLTVYLELMFTFFSSSIQENENLLQLGTDC